MFKKASDPEQEERYLAVFEEHIPEMIAAFPQEEQISASAFYEQLLRRERQIHRPIVVYGEPQLMEVEGLNGMFSLLHKPEKGEIRIEFRSGWRKKAYHPKLASLQNRWIPAFEYSSALKSERILEREGEVEIQWGYEGVGIVEVNVKDGWGCTAFSVHFSTEQGRSIRQFLKKCNEIEQEIALRSK